MSSWAKFRRFGKTSPGKERRARRRSSGDPDRGPKVLLESRSEDAIRTGVLAAVAERYEITTIGDDNRRCSILVDDALYPDEAVVRLVSVLDEIDRDWERYYDWPKAQA